MNPLKALGTGWQLYCQHIFARASYRLCHRITFPHWHLAALLKLSRPWRNIESWSFRQTRQCMIKRRILMLSQYKLCLKESLCWGTILFLSIDVQTRLSFQAIFKSIVEASPPCGQCCSWCAFLCQTVVPCRRWGIASRCKINDPATGKSNELEAPNVLSLQSNGSFFISVRPKHQLCT